MPTPQLYDPGEEDFGLRLHAGCGSVYLEGYVNADVQGFHPYEKPELLTQNRTTIDDYYGRKAAGDRHVEKIPPSTETVLDLIADVRELPYADNVDKIVCIQVLEHLTRTEADRALLRFWNCLKTDGILILSVPDPIATAKILDTDVAEVRQFCIRHLMGSGKDTYAFHHWAYTEPILRILLAGHGFGHIERLDNFHFYPAVVLKCKKIDLRCPAREYQPVEIDTSMNWRVLDVGPGDFPYASATEFADIEPREVPGKFHLIKSVEELPFLDDEFDFIYCSHVLEHCQNPVLALKELQRAGKRGFIEVPSILKDFWLQYGETHPKWACWGWEQALIFIEKSPEQNELFQNSTFGAFMHGTIHTKVKLNHIERALRFFFWKSQKLLNVWAYWDKDRDLTIEAVQIQISGKGD